MEKIQGLFIFLNRFIFKDFLRNIVKENHTHHNDNTCQHYHVQGKSDIKHWRQNPILNVH